MSLPSKVTPYKKSTIFKFPVVLSVIKQGAVSPAELYMQTHAQFSGIAEYIEILDELYALGSIKFDSAERRIYYAL